MKGKETYGLCMDDPVRVSGFYQEHVYLAQLCRNGTEKPVRAERLGSGRSEKTGNPVDIYKIAGAGLFARKTLVYIDIYGETDWRAPEGFHLTGDPPGQDGADDVDETLKSASDAIMNAIRALTGK